MHKNFNRSGLVRQLSAWLPGGAEASRQDIAERLGQWLSVPDTISLRTAHRSIPAIRRVPGASSPGELAGELQQVRETLVKSITASAAGDAASEVDTDFALFHQRYVEQQRRMEMSVDALRGHARDTLSRTSSRLAQLAALDASLDELLGGREQHLLASVPAFLKKRFGQLRKEQAEQLAGGQPSTAWATAFARELQQALLAELDVRLQPIQGMIDALGQELNHENP